MSILPRALGWSRRHPQRFFTAWMAGTLAVLGGLGLALYETGTGTLTWVSVLLAAGGVQTGSGFVVYRLLMRESRNKARMTALLLAANRAAQREQALNEALQDSANFQQAVLNSSSCGIVATDTGGAILFMNRAGSRILGFPIDEVVGKMSPLVFHRTEDIRVALHRIRPGDLPYQLMVNHLRAHPGREWQFIRKDGSTVWVSIDVAVLKQGSGRSQGFVTIFNDLSELKQMERIKADFVSVVSHELRAPLTAIRGALSLHQAAIGDALALSQLRLLSIATDNCDKLVRIVANILDIDKLSRDQMTLDCTVESPLRLAEAAIAQTQPFADQYAVTFRLNPSDEQLRVSVDADRFIQIMVNLLSNAAKFSLPRGEVMVSIRAEFGRAVIRVVDYGVGIQESLRPFIFDRFSQSRSGMARKAGGTGLGLAITKMLVNAHNGTIDCQSEEGFGTTFTISLPVVTVSKAPATPGPDVQSDDSGG